MPLESDIGCAGTSWNANGRSKVTSANHKPLSRRNFSFCFIFRGCYCFFFICIIIIIFFFFIFFFFIFVFFQTSDPASGSVGQGHTRARFAVACRITVCKRPQTLIVSPGLLGSTASAVATDSDPQLVPIETCRARFPQLLLAELTSPTLILGMPGGRHGGSLARSTALLCS